MHALLVQTPRRIGMGAGLVPTIRSEPPQAGENRAGIVELSGLCCGERRWLRRRSVDWCGAAWVQLAASRENSALSQ